MDRILKAKEKFENLIGFRLAVISGLWVLSFVVLIAALMVVSVSSFKATSRDINQAATAIKELNNTVLTFKRIRVDLRDFLIDFENRAQFKGRVVELIDVLNRHVANLEELATNDIIQKELAALNGKLPVFYDVGGRIIAAGEANNQEAGKQILISECFPIASAIVENLLRLFSLYENMSISAQANLETVLWRILVVLILITGTSILLFILVIRYFNKTIVTPVVKIGREVKKLSGGDLTLTETDIEAKYEVGILWKNLTNSVTRMREAIASVLDISAVTSSVDNAVKEMRAISDQTAVTTRLVVKNSQSMATQLDETRRLIARGVHDMKMATSKMSETKEVLLAMDQDAQQMSQLSAEGSDKIQLTVQQMTSTGERVGELANGCQRLTVCSDKIKSVIDGISNISDQINTLAINASIVAARAGEPGRAFAVVANEIRKLAGQTFTQAAEITNITKLFSDEIRSIQQASQRSVSDMVESMALISENKKLADNSSQFSESASQMTTQLHLTFNELDQLASKTGLSINEIDKSSIDIIDTVAEFSTASRQQAEAIQKLSVALLAVEESLQILTRKTGYFRTA